MLTQNLAAVILSPGARFETQVRPIPKPGAGEILVRNHAIAANPVDWKIQDYSFAVKTYPSVLGSDISGEVTAVGPSVTKFKNGDRVTGFAAVIYNDNADHGAWQTYTLLKETSTTKIPDFMSFEEASVFPMAMATASVALFTCLGLPLPSLDTNKPTTQTSGFLIWGASSSIGVSALQIAKNLGFKIFATASPTHHSHLQNLGATAVFDYRSPSVIQDLISAAKEAGTPIKYGFDAIGEGVTFTSSASAILESGGKGGKLVTALPWPKEEKLPEGIEIRQDLGAYRHATDAKEMGTWFFNEYLQKELEEKRIVPAPEIEVLSGGVADAQKALDLVKKGVSGKKIIVRVD